MGGANGFGWRTAAQVLALGLALFAWSTPRAELRFQRIGVAEGLSQATILCAHHDPAGFLWFCTQEGLNRYDGHRFQVFRRSELTGLGDSYIDDVADASDGGLWVGTGYRGLFHFDPVRERFRPIPLFDGPQTFRIQDLLVTSDGALWIATETEGLWRYDPVAGDARQVFAEADVLTLLEDRSGVIWIGTFDRGLWRLPPGAAEPVQLARRPVTVEALLELPDGDIWVGSDSGIDVYDGASTKKRSAPVPKLKDVNALFRDSRSRLWIATDSGLHRRLPGEDSWSFHTHVAADDTSLSDSVIGHLSEDRNGNLWVGTWLAGANLLQGRSGPFRTLDNETAGEEGWNSAATGVVEDLDGRLWAAFYRGVGLARWDGAAARWVTVGSTGLPGAPGSDPLARVIGLDSETGRIWIVTNDGTVSFIERGSTTPTPLAAHPLRGFSAEEIRASGDRLYVATVTRGLVELDARSGALVRALTQDDGLPISYVQTARQFGDRLWVGTTRGLALVDAVDWRVETVLTAEEGRLSHNAVTAIHRAGDGALWVGTQGGGLNRLVQQGDGWELSVLDSTRGLSSDAIGGIREDDLGNLWVSTAAGVTRIAPDGGLRNFGPEDGLRLGGFYIGSHAQGQSGRISFGGTGVLLVEPGAYRLPEALPGAVVTGFRVRNESVPVEPDGALAQAIAYADRLTIRPSDILVTFEFSALRPAYGADLRYRYRIPSLDEQWIITKPGQGEATFSNLPYGDRVLEVAASFDGVRWGPARRLLLDVRAPWWRTPQALALFVGLFALALALPIRLQLQKRRERVRHQEAIARSEERLRMALWGSADELWYYDADRDETQLTYFDQERQAFVALEAESPERRAKLVHPDDREMAVKALRDYVAGRSETVEAVYRARAGNGEWHWYQLRGTAVERRPDGRPRLVAGTRRDIHRRMTAMLALEELNVSLEEKVGERTAELERTRDVLVQNEKMAALGGLVSGVAHELNTPIGNALTVASHLEDRLRPALLGAAMTAAQAAQLRDGVNVIIRNMERAANLVRSFKRVAVVPLSRRTRSFGLRGYLEDILSSLRPSQENRYTLFVDCPPELQLSADPAVLYQVIQSLVTNSTTHGFAEVEAPEIGVVVTTEDGFVVIDYRDNGSGIEASIRQRIFEPFVTTARASGSTGLGMHIVYNMVTQTLGGSIEAYEPDSGGAGFRIVLPQAPTPPAPGPGEPATSALDR